MPAKSTTKKAAGSKKTSKPTTSKTTAKPKAGAKGKPAASSPRTPASATPASDADELVVFAFRLRRSERDEIHAAAGSARASRFVRSLAIAAARGDSKAIKEIMAGAGSTK